MTNLYTPDGVLDYVEAARTIAGLKHTTNATSKAEATDRVAAAALLDIAVSLNHLVVLAEGAEFPLGSDAPDDEKEDEEVDDDERQVGPDGEPLDEPERDEEDWPIEVGSWVVARAGDAPAFTQPRQVLALDFRDDEPVISFGQAWLYARAFRRVAPPAEVPGDADAPGGVEVDDEPTGRDMVDELDSDFDTPTLIDAPAVKGASKPKGKRRNKRKGKGDGGE